MKKILVINGPNLNLLGTREPDIYGKKTLNDIEEECKKEFKNIKIIFTQSNSESEIIELIHNTEGYGGIIINAGAFTHTSIAIHDALKAIKLPKVEVHISNIYNRDDFRKKSFISPVVDGIIAGFGTNVYKLAINSLVNG
ncbi:MAG: type II 3-dehydroquinate dehydratase [Alphaproteobacteria bacterium]